MSATIASYIASLKELAEKAGEASLRWLAAERLVQLDEGRDPGCFLLRAAALAALGEADAARDDAKEAFRVDPGVPGLAEGILPAFAPGPARDAALLHRLRAGSAPGEGVLAMVRAAGHGALVLAEVVAGEVGSSEVRGTLWWQEGAVPTLRLRHAGGDVSVPLQPVTPGGASFAKRAAFSLPWPEGATHVALIAEGALLVPDALVAVEPPRFATAISATAGLLVIVPAYADWPALSRCLDAVLPQLGGNRRLVVIDDASPDPALRAGLAALAQARGITVLRNPLNLGFAGAVNRGLAERAPGEDVLLLNSDATLPPTVLERLQHLAQSAPDIATLTPLSNNGEDTSLPRRFLPNAEPDDAVLARLDAAARAANGDLLIEIPNGVGFCLYVTNRGVERIGGLSGVFERGYFEDVDFCLRAGEAGLRNLAAAGVYVAHAGSRSFGGEKRAYVRRNLARLKALHPGYDAASEAFIKADPLSGPAEALVRAFLAANPVAQVVVAPSDCARAYALAAGWQPGDGLLLRPLGKGWHIEAAYAGFEGELKTQSPDLSEVLPWLAQARIARLDGERLAPAWREALPAQAVSPLVPAMPVALPAPTADFAGYALLAPELNAQNLMKLGPLFARHPEARFVFLDSMSPAVECHVCVPPRSLTLGDVSPDQLVGVMRRAGLEALVVVDSRYGRLDPRRATALAAGVPVFDLA